MAKGGSVTVGYRYFMSLHMGLCRGPIDELVQINVGDVRAWPIPDGDSETTSGKMFVAQGPGGVGVAMWESGAATHVDASEINTISLPGGSVTTKQINAPNLFGGDKKEGGIQGTMNMLWGRASQLVPANIAALMGGLVPSFRGVASIFYDGLLCSLNPYPKTWTFRVRRVTSGWDGAVWQPDLAAIWMWYGRIKAMNGAHIIYECLTNRDWGRGYPRSWINDASFTAAAQKLYDEKFGLCIRWTRTQELSDFIQMVVEHIGGTLYVDPATGLISLDLMREAESGEAIPTFTYDTGLLKIDDDETASASEIINEMVVEWKDPVLNETRQARVHNQASLQANSGGVNNNKKSYEGIPEANLALLIAQRDLTVSANSLKRYKVALDRRAWAIVPGRRFRITASDRDISNLTLRAGKVEEQADGSFMVTALLDVFAMPARNYVAPEPIAWTQSSRTPQSANERLIQEASYRDMVLSLGPGDLSTLMNTQAGIVTMAAKPSAMSLGYRIHAKPDGGEYDLGGTGAFVPAGTTTAFIGPHGGNIEVNLLANSILAPQNLNIKVGAPVYVGSELCKILSVAGNVFGIGRGCGDTIPVSHPAGETVFFPGPLALDFDEHEYVSGEQVSVKLATFTSTSELKLDLTPADTLTMVGRHARPYPPAQVRINGIAFGQTGNLSRPIEFTWVHRNRLTIKDKLISHTDSGTPLEAGVTYTIRIYPSTGASTPVRTVSGITVNSWTYTQPMVAEDGVSGTIVVELEAVRGSLTSFKRYRFSITLA